MLLWDPLTIYVAGLRKSGPQVSAKQLRDVL